MEMESYILIGAFVIGCAAIFKLVWEYISEIEEEDGAE